MLSLYWPDNWYANIVGLAVAAYAIHWPISYYLDRRFGLTKKKWYDTVSGTVPLGEAIFVACAYFVLFPPTPLADAQSGILAAARIVIGLHGSVFFFLLAAQWTAIIERSDDHVHFLAHDAGVQGGTWEYILSLPGVILLPMAWFIITRRFAGEYNNPSETACDGGNSLDSSKSFAIPCFIPYARQFKFHALPIHMLQAGTLFGIVAILLVNNDAPSSLIVLLFLLLGLLPAHWIAIWCGGLEVSELGLRLKGALCWFDRADSGLNLLRGFEQAQIGWENIHRIFVEGRTGRRRLVVELDGEQRYRMGERRRPQFTMKYPLDAEIDSLTAFLNLELEKQKNQIVT